MRKHIVYMAVALTICVALSGCSGEGSAATPPAPTTSPGLTDDALNELEASMIVAVNGKCEIETCRADQFENGDTKLTVWLKTSTKVSNFGNAIYDIMEAVPTIESDNSIELDDIDVCLKDKNGEVMLIFSIGIGDLGSIYDYRSGDGKMTPYNSYDELAKDYPALTLYMDK